MGALPSFICELRHELMLTLAQPVQPVPVYALADLLSNAAIFFKNQRDASRGAVYNAGPYRANIEHDGEIYAALEISRPADESKNFLSTDDWTKAVIEAFSVADIVQDLVRRKNAYQKAITTTGDSGWVRDALTLIRKPSGDLQAFAMKMKELLVSTAT